MLKVKGPYGSPGVGLSFALILDSKLFLKMVTLRSLSLDRCTVRPPPGIYAGGARSGFFSPESAL
jgi:hypothetical protein